MLQLRTHYSGPVRTSRSVRTGVLIPSTKSSRLLKKPARVNRGSLFTQGDRVKEFVTN